MNKNQLLENIRSDFITSFVPAGLVGSRFSNNTPDDKLKILSELITRSNVNFSRTFARTSTFIISRDCIEFGMLNYVCKDGKYQTRLLVRCCSSAFSSSLTNLVFNRSINISSLLVKPAISGIVDATFFSLRNYEKTLNCLREMYPEQFRIIDAKINSIKQQYEAHLSQIQQFL